MNTWGANGLVSRTAAQGTSALSTQNSTFYTFDQHGATCLAAGTQEFATNAYDAYGQPVAGSGPTSGDPYSGYGGQEGYYSDQATGLYLLGHRFYDPASGRFLNRDPAGDGNLYAYADGNPEDGGDPSGFYNIKTGPQNAPWLEFNNQVVNEGLRVGTGTVLYKFSGGHFNPGADVLCDPSFGVSSTLADISMNAGMLALGGIGEAAEAEEGVEIAEEAAEGLTCPCFVAGTLVEMADGTKKPIQDVHLGEYVMSRDPITGEVKAEPVAQVFTHPASNLVTVTLSDGETLTCTPTHPFYVSGKGFVPAGELTAGEKLVSGAEAQGDAGAKAVTVSRVAWQKETARAGTAGAQTLVYNLGIASTHTYFVGTQNDGVWVHNVCGGKFSSRLKIDPQNIRFLQDSIENKFTDGDLAGTSLEDAIAMAKEAGELPEGLNINVTEVDGDLVTLNNRSLYVAQEAGLTRVPVTDVGPSGWNQAARMMRDANIEGPLPFGTQPIVRP